MNIEMYEISIIIPVYNVCEYLKDCFTSLQNQTIGFENLEIIMADDCSTDDSRSIMESYERQYGNVKCIYLSENSGTAGKPRNEAMKIATAEYIMFLDPDDEYYEDACQTLLEMVQNNHVDCVSGDYSVLYGNVILNESMHDKSKIEEKVYYMPADIGEISFFQSSFSCKIYRKEIIRKYNIVFPEKMIGQDTVFVWRYLCAISTVYYISKPIHKYKQRKGINKSVSYILTEKYFEDTLRVLTLIGELFSAKGIVEKVGDAYRNTNSYFVHQLINSDLPITTVRNLLSQWDVIVGTDKNFNSGDDYLEIVMGDIMMGNMENAADKIMALQKIKRWTEELLEGKVWLEQQVKYKDERINELQDQISQLEERNALLEQKVELQGKNTRFSRLLWRRK